ncbi:MAG: bacteriochlorophyll synthase [Archaeoglobus sp.]|nr:MAG: bacteriochlorophyll synthase [Archaeoglobus sp.]
MYDVVVAGVGIAGAFTLRTLSKNLKVVGIDKREKLGYPVECGELVPTKKEMKSLLPHLEDYSIFDIPEKYTSNRTKFLEFVIPNGKSVKVEFEMLVINRDRFISEIAEKSGHEIRNRTKILGYEPEEQKLNLRDLNRMKNYELKADVVVASDGANSRIAKSLGVWKYEIASAKQYVMTDVECDEDTVYMFVGSKIAPGGYAWIIPKGNGIANVGVGIRQSFISKDDSIHKILDRFVKEYPYSSRYLKRAEVICKIGAVAPVDKPIDKTVFNRTLLVGDSASMILSHVAAGIPVSMIAGDIAGRVVNDYFNGKADIEMYERIWREKLLDTMMNSYRIKQLWDKISITDEKICKYFKFIGKKDMAAILRSRIPVKLRIAEPFMPILNIVF